MMKINQPIAPVVGAGELAALLREQPGIRLLDVRTPGEYESVHIPGAYNVPLDTLGEHGDEIRAHVETPVVLVCQSGNRARKAEEALRQAGMPNLHVLDGGVNGWVAAGQRVARGAERVSLERQVRIVAGALAATGGLLAVGLNPLFGLLAAFVGSGLVFAGVTDTCGMAMVLSRLPYNRPASCDVDAMVQALKTGAAPAGMGRAPAASAGTASCSR
ncbi:rhodanese-like domain-containing protein [Longimicrobium sp.]|jgi:rhodanese-related sulfurtransferase|uniref:rhodanese-like domain-containing protein n=1 Tax=Longimicrobium sp. TaxID=2029185 RepID=UPI002ED893FF